MGLKTDVGFCRNGIKALVVKTAGFDSLPIDDLEYCFRIALDRINPRTDFIIFDPERLGKPYLEDEGRTLIVPSPNIDKKVYAKLDDYNGNEEEAFGYRWVITLMLAEEY